MEGTGRHPYIPQTLHLPHYVPNERDLPGLLAPFFGAVTVVVVLTWMITRKTETPAQRLKMCWIVVCGLIHTILEGYFALHHKTLAGENAYLAEVWKEYSKGDSRYVGSDSFVVCVESFTAFVDGPLAFLAFYTFFTRSRSRYIVQLLLSLCQLYGDILYFYTEFHEGFSHGYVNHPLYFWFYFVFMNAIWIVIPAMLIWESCRELSKAQAVRDNLKHGKRR